MRGTAGSFCLPTFILPILFVVTACSSPPEKERGQAEGAIAAARAASAETYAPDILRAAEEALARYDSAVAQKDYRQALSAALDARDRAYEAVTAAGTAKAEARGRTEQLMQSIEQLSATATARLSGSRSPRLTGAAAGRVRTAVNRATTAMQEARTAVVEGRYLDAVSGLEQALAGLQEALGSRR